MHKGTCLCGAVSFEVTGSLPPPNGCHCSQCRKRSGHFWVSTDVAREALTIEGESNLMWYQASTQAKRGFCSTCGSFLFGDPTGKDTVAVALGAFDPPTGTKLASHIFVADKGDYYDITDGVPQHQQSP